MPWLVLTSLPGRQEPNVTVLEPLQTGPWDSRERSVIAWYEQADRGSRAMKNVVPCRRTEDSGSRSPADDSVTATW